MYPQQIIDALRHVRYPGTGKDLIESGMLEDDIRISGFEVSFSLIFPKDNDPFIKSVMKASEVALQTYIDPNVVANIHPKYRIENRKPAVESSKKTTFIAIPNKLFHTQWLCGRGVSHRPNPQSSDWRNWRAW